MGNRIIDIVKQFLSLLKTKLMRSSTSKPNAKGKGIKAVKGAKGTIKLKATGKGAGKKK